MKLWPITTKNKCFVKMLWHLLGECVKATVFLVCSIYTCKHKISQLQKFKQLKRNMVCKYKFVLMNNEYNLYFNSFTKKIPFDSIFFELDSNKESSWL